MFREIIRTYCRFSRSVGACYNIKFRYSLSWQFILLSQHISFHRRKLPDNAEIPCGRSNRHKFNDAIRIFKFTKRNSYFIRSSSCIGTRLTCRKDEPGRVKTHTSTENSVKQSHSPCSSAIIMITDCHSLHIHPHALPLLHPPGARLLPALLNGCTLLAGLL